MTDSRSPEDRLREYETLTNYRIHYSRMIWLWTSVILPIAFGLFGLTVAYIDEPELRTLAGGAATYLVIYWYWTTQRFSSKLRQQKGVLINLEKELGFWHHRLALAISNLRDRCTRWIFFTRKISKQEWSKEWEGIWSKAKHNFNEDELEREILEDYVKRANSAKFYRPPPLEGRTLRRITLFGYILAWMILVLWSWL